MKGIRKTMLRTCAGVAIATAAVVGGAGVASAAPVSPAATTTSHFGFGCNPFGYEQWNVNGSNTVEAVYLGTTYSYSIYFNQYGGCLSGTMTDSYYPTTGPIHGSISGNYITFSFRYPSGSIQGTRTFSGYIHPQFYKIWYQHWVWNGFRWVLRWTFRYGVHGYVSGTWSETGSEGGSGSWSLASGARFR
jgi:hypothetical protein